MYAVIARVGQSEAVARRWPRAVSPVLICLAGSCAWAQDEDQPVLIAQAYTTFSADERLRPQLELSTTSLPRFDNIDGATRSSRIGMTWLPSRRSALGLSLGMTTLGGTAMPLAAPYPGTLTSVDLGLHWRYTPEGNYRIDVTAWRRVAPADAMSLIYSREPSYGARVEMRIGPAPRKTGLVADRGFIGFQLESGARITLRRSGGQPMIYYRTKF